MGLLVARKGMPRTMVLIAEQNIGMAAPRAAWMRGEAALVSADLRIAETTVLDVAEEGRVRAADRSGDRGEEGRAGGRHRDRRHRGASTQAEVADRRRGHRLSARRSRPHAASCAISGPGWRSCAATLSGRAVNTDSGDILASGETTQNAAQLDDLSCGKEAIRKASRSFAEEMTKKIAARWSAGRVRGQRHPRPGPQRAFVPQRFRLPRRSLAAGPGRAQRLAAELRRGARRSST